MSDTSETSFAPAFLQGSFIEYLKTLPWCSQEGETLVAVFKLTSEIIEAVRESEVKLFPGGMIVKLPRSVLMGLQQKCDEEQPLPAVLVWKKSGLEIWFRRQKSADFPYDTWSDPGALAIEREKGVLSAAKLGDAGAAAHAELLSKAKQCPTMIPQY
ncbi:MAG: hypothetical protein JSS83_26270 [Cyanobacteria bacterium SZAS LIN-3]|nr:hypothetical protein [Cyanobacteria bacterium SZAS LIN-3]